MGSSPQDERLNRETLESRELIARAARSGGDESWEQLFRRYHRRLVGYGRELLGPRLKDDLDAEDLAAETWRRVLPRISDFEYTRKDSFFDMLRTNARWVASDQARRGGEGKRQLVERRRHDVHEMGSNIGESGPGVVTQVHRDEISDRVRQAVNDPRLPKMYRELLQGFLIEHRSRDELSRITGVQRDTVRKQIRRGLERLTAILGEVEG